MSTFASQFDRARPYADAYAGDPDDPTWRSPGEAGAGGNDPSGEAAGAGQDWGENWDAGWGEPDPDGSGDAGGGAWMERGDYTDAGVGGDGDSFYFIDGDSSLMLD